MSVLLAGALTVRVALRVRPAYVAEIVVLALELTAVVETVNVALVAPAGTVTLAGTVAAAVLLLESAIDAPPDGAAASSVTVPVELSPPVTVVGLRASDDSAGSEAGATVTLKLRLTVAPCASVSRSVKENVPAVVGVPPTRTSGPSGLSWISAIPVGS